MKCKEEESKAGTRFRMVKERHSKRFNKARKEKEADERMIPLCKFIAGTKNYFTSSSCAGRILLLKVNEKGDKKEASFHRKWHRKVKLEEVWNGIEEKVNERELWFKMEPFIIHVGTHSLDKANKLLEVMNKAGVKRGGIIVAKKGKFIVEMSGTQNMAFPVKIGEKIIIEKNYLKKGIEKANWKIEKNYWNLKRVEKEMKKELK
ncbi:MAG: hypothetical protein ABIE23_05210 [archaeon]